MKLDAWQFHDFRSSLAEGGWWWPAGKPELSIPGTLSGPGDNGLYYLEVVVDERQWPETANDVDARSFVIHGTTHDGVDVTLLEILPIGHSLRIPGSTQWKCAVPIVVAGLHVRDGTEPCGDCCTTSYYGLEDWFVDRGLRINLTPPEDAQFDFDYGIAFCVGGTQLNGTLESDFWICAQQGVAASLTLHRQLSFRPIGGVSVRDAMRISMQLAEWLTLLVGETMSPKSTWVRTKDRVGVILWESPFEKRFGGKHHQMMFSLPMLLPQSLRPAVYAPLPIVCTVLVNYLRLKQQYREVLDIVLALVNRPDYYVEVKFTAAMQALEAYCRRSGLAGPVIANEIYRSVRRQLDNAYRKTAPAPLKGMLKKQLRYANRPTLGMQIDQLLAHLDPALVSAIAPNGAQTFRNAVVRARNLLAHPGSGEEAADGLLSNFNAVLALLYILMLRELGFSAPAILVALRRSHRWRNTIPAL